MRLRETSGDAIPGHRGAQIGGKRCSNRAAASSAIETPSCAKPIPHGETRSRGALLGIAGRCTEPYPRHVARVSSTRGFLPIVAAGLLLTWVIGSGSHAGPPEPSSTPTSAAAIDPIAELLSAESGQPTVSRHTRLDRVQRGVWITPAPTLAVNVVVPWRSTHQAPPTLSRGRVAQGRTGRGPPFLGVL